MRTLLYSVLLFLGYNVYSQAIPLKIEMNNLRSTNGNIVVAVYKDQKGFNDDNPFLREVISKKGNMRNETFVTELLLPQGTFGLAFFDDENNDRVMNYNLIGMPKEGFGFSNFYHTGLTTPKFSDFSFVLTDSTKTMRIRLRYM